MSAFINARGAPSPLALARRPRAALGPQALPSLLILLLLPSNAHAEYSRIVLKIFGMDCATCAHGVRVAIQKIDGVDTVALSLERAEADIRLRQDNRVSLDQFRRIAKANGFEPRQATVTAVGTVREVKGALAFEVSGVPAPLLVVIDRSAPAAYQQLKSAWDSKKSGAFEIVGTVENKGDGVERIAVASVTAK
jgi:copper chaperone CopZ